MDSEVAVTEDITIDRMTHDEAMTCLDWARAEGWNPGLHDADVFYGTDPEGFFAAHHHGELAGSISVVRYPGRFSFGGLLIVRPDYRNKGLGKLLIAHMLRSSSDTNLGCDGVLNMVKSYESYGLVPAYENFRYIGKCVRMGSPSPDLVPISSVPFAQLARYDAGMFPSERKRFLRLWIDQPGSLGLACLSDGRMMGYGVIRKCHVGYKVGPLFADNETIAAGILSSLISGFPGEDFILDVPSPNRGAVDLAQDLGMQKVFSTVRMYTQGTPDLDIERIFGVTSFELG
jgi:GNAT superfamily N-acetyltransferase